MNQLLDLVWYGSWAALGASIISLLYAAYAVYRKSKGDAK